MMNTEFRSARPGDFCILLEPSETRSAFALPNQLRLQDYFGGRLITPVHVTCERFELADEQLLPQVIRELERASANHHPFPITAVSLKSVRSAFRGNQILKWRVPITAELSQFVADVERILDGIGATRYYGHYEGESLVSALEQITETEVEAFLAQANYPQHLFVVEQTVLSKIMRPGVYEIMARFSLAREEHL